MSAPAFDTRAAAENLESGGFLPAQAAALTKVLADATQPLATKQDLKHLESRMNGKLHLLRQEIQTQREETRANIAEGQKQIIISMIVTMIAVGGVMLTAAKFFL